MRLQTAFCCLLYMAAITGVAWTQDPTASEAPAKDTTSADFKISTSVYVPHSTTPVSENLTLFQGGLVYDIQFANRKPTEFSIFNSRTNKFVLLDVRKQKRLELDKIQLLQYLSGMKQELEANETMAPLSKTDFQEHYDIDKQTLTIDNSILTYSAQGERPADDSVLPRYHDFLENFTMLSATKPRSFPPFARIYLNRAIKKYGFVPTTVSRTIKENAFSRSSGIATSSHRLAMSLTKNDLDWIQLAKKHWTQFPKVDLSEYLSIEVANNQGSANKR